MKQPFRHAGKPAAKTMDDIGTSNTKYTSYFREQQSCHGRSSSRRVAPKRLPSRGFQGIGIVFSRENRTDAGLRQRTIDHRHWLQWRPAASKQLNGANVSGD
jgi:hypothetical protein